MEVTCETNFSFSESSETLTTQPEETEPEEQDSRVLVAYFSATNTTEGVAEHIANGQNADFNYNDNNSRTTIEMNDSNARPVISGSIENMEQYDIVFIGYPIWWNLAPRIIDTFIETHHLAGKTLIPFATSGGSGITNSVGALKKAYPDLNWKEGKLLNRMDENGIREWIGKTSKD